MSLATSSPGAQTPKTPQASCGGRSCGSRSWVSRPSGLTTSPVYDQAADRAIRPAAAAAVADRSARGRWPLTCPAATASAQPAGRWPAGPRSPGRSPPRSAACRGCAGDPRCTGPPRTAGPAPRPPGRAPGRRAGRAGRSRPPAAPPGRATRPASSAARTARTQARPSASGSDGPVQAGSPSAARCSSTAARSRSAALARADALLAGPRRPARSRLALASLTSESSAEQGRQRALVGGGELGQRHAKLPAHLQAVAPGRAQRGGHPVLRAQPGELRLRPGRTATTARAADSLNRNVNASPGRLTRQPCPPARQHSASATARPPSDRSCAAASRPARAASASSDAAARSAARSTAGGRPPRWPCATCAHTEPPNSARSGRAARAARPGGRTRSAPGAARRRARRARRPPASGGSPPPRSGCRS